MEVYRDSLNLDNTASVKGNCGDYWGEMQEEDITGVCVEGVERGSAVLRQVPHSPVRPVPRPALATQAAVAPVHHVGQRRPPRAALDGSRQLQQPSL